MTPSTQPPPHNNVNGNSGGDGDDNDAHHDHHQFLDEMSIRIRHEALETLQEEPELSALLHRTVLAPGVQTFEDAVAATVCYRLIQQPCSSGGMPSIMMGDSCGGKSNGNNNTAQAAATATNPPLFCPNSLKCIMDRAFAQTQDDGSMLEYGHTMSYAVRKDAMAVLQRDPACHTLLEVVLFYKGFAALVCHRAARQKWFQTAAAMQNTANNNKKRRNNMTALFLQSQCSAVFGLDIHPATTIGAGVMLDHGTGVVLGETAVVGDGCTLLHGVTLGGTGKETGDRHPKVGNDVLIGAGASLLGNIRIGHGCKIGAGSIVLRAIPDGATAVGAPAKIVGRAEPKPGSTMDETFTTDKLLHTSESMVQLQNLLQKSESTNTVATAATTASSLASEVIEEDAEDGEESTTFCPYRDYQKVQAPAGSITFCLLKKWLSSKGCTMEEIGSVFFALDTRSVGYIYVQEFQEHALDVMQQHITSLPPTKLQELLETMPLPPTSPHECVTASNKAPLPSSTALLKV